MDCKTAAGYTGYRTIPRNVYITTNAEENIYSAAIFRHKAHQDDIIYVQRFLAGDAKAFEALMLIHQHSIYSLCLRMMGQHQDALDMSQEVKYRIYRSLCGFKAQASFSTWIYRIIKNICIDELRRRKRSNTVSLDALSEMGYEWGGIASSPESAYILKEIREDLAKAMVMLPSNQRAVVVLHDMQCLSYKEVAHTLSLNLNTVKSRISRGRLKLRLIITERAEPM